MFQTTPKQVKPTTVPKTGRKNADVAHEHFTNGTQKLEEALLKFEAILKPKEKDQSIQEFRKQVRAVCKDAKDAKKFLEKYKNIRYRPKRTRESHNTGLEKPRMISEAMATFADWEYGKTEKSRYDVTKYLCAYIKDNDLRDASNKTIILPDAKLKKLLQVDDSVVLKYPTMQKYLKHCFDEVVARAPSPTTELGAAELTDDQTTAEEAPKEVKKSRKPKEVAVPQPPPEEEEVAPVEQQQQSVESEEEELQLPPPKPKKSTGKKDKENIPLEKVKKEHKIKK
ncbi:hypothetical protein MIV070L [Invertebrate iridescent virus 3]|uniref:Putative SWIB domain-containing protein 070L n=1 Tax=Invertebrate iridescent virus 3 TaxID=345201 RepID=VF306_IIV3|nr:hypothetical protein MIV070L [Invertebrate iridescent virus 3]Q196Z0.1 RecName: Full=Putative SWIB domain-containing protein 070L [Invertebrate iridescent virus 3]ABF82100.1 hypothetical protein MIV070L [Invertebrate iridescent virus 3]